MGQMMDLILLHAMQAQPAATLVLLGWFERNYPIYQAISDYVATHQKPVIWGLDEEAFKDALQRAGEDAEAGDHSGDTRSDVPTCFASWHKFHVSRAGNIAPRGLRT